MAVYFTSDHHFGHGGARGLFKRPFATTRAMDEAMVARWNEAVGANDIVWHLGDFAVRQPRARMQALLDALNGTKNLIVGNNDGPATKALWGWHSVQAYVELEIEGRRLVLCHYPLRSWNGMAKGAIQLHGHTHGRMAPLTRQLDVGVDPHDFRPLALEDVFARALRRRQVRRA